MADKYNRKCALLFAPKDTIYWAVTVGQTTFFSCPQLEVGPAWHAHEDRHKEQWKRDGFVKFFFRYIYYHFVYGYEKNPYEMEARLAENEVEARR